MKKIVTVIVIAIAVLLVTNAYGKDTKKLLDANVDKEPFMKELVKYDCDKLQELYTASIFKYKFNDTMCEAANWCFENSNIRSEKAFWSDFLSKSNNGFISEICFMKMAQMDDGIDTLPTPEEINDIENAKENIYNAIKDVNPDSTNSNILTLCDNLMESATLSRITDDDFDTLCDTADDCIDTADSRKEVKFWHDIKSQCFYKEMQKVKSVDS